MRTGVVEVAKIISAFVQVVAFIDKTVHAAAIDDRLAGGWVDLEVVRTLRPVAGHGLATSILGANVFVVANGGFGLWRAAIGLVVVQTVAAFIVHASADLAHVVRRAL